MSDEPLVLGIETSCDETGVGIVRGTTLLADANFLSSLAITLRYTLETAVPLILLSLGLALLLNQRLRLSGVFQVIYFVPVVMPVRASMCGVHGVA